MKYKAHQTFFVRKGWLSKGMRAVENDKTIFMPSKSKTAMDQLGLGANQVVALRYWLIVMGLIKKSRNGKFCETTALFNLIRDKDPYIEELGTLWALHCNLASNKDEATSWYWLFNECKTKVFTKKSLVEGIKKYDDSYNTENLESGKNTAVSSIESDVDCILKTYISNERLTGKTTSPENVIDCPLGDLGILDIEDRQAKTFRKKPAILSILPPELVLYSILRKSEIEETDALEIPIDDLLDSPYSPGLLFNLDSATLLSKLYELENSGDLRINRTAGSDVIRLKNSAADPLNCLKAYYEALG